jgi:hypothetical protein
VKKLADNTDRMLLYVQRCFSMFKIDGTLLHVQGGGTVLRETNFTWPPLPGFLADQVVTLLLKKAFGKFSEGT